MPKMSKNKSRRWNVKKLLRRNQGGFVHITALLYELSRSYGSIVTRDTMRKWLVAAGCEHKGGGVYEVPAFEKRQREEVEDAASTPIS